MNKILFILAFILVLSGCDYTIIGRNDEVIIRCVEGKEFISIKGIYGISINLDMNGKPIPCTRRYK